MSNHAANEGLRQLAERHMRAKEFPAAITLLERHLESDRNDLRAQMELGICHLLNGADEPFRRIYQELSGILAQARDLPMDVKRLWEHYSGLFVKLSSTALVVGTLSTLAGCQSAAETNQAAANGSTNVSTAAVIPPTSSSHRYSAGVYIPPKPDTQPSTQPTTKPTTKPVPPSSSHKYSGGVYMKPDWKE